MNIEERIERIEAHLGIGKAEQPQTKERTFEAFYVDCTRDEYPEVQEILEAQGYELKDAEWRAGDDCVTTTTKGVYMPYEMSDKIEDEPVYTLPQLREKFGVEQPQQYVGFADETAEPQVHGIVNTLDAPASGNSEKPNTQEPPAQPIYEAGFSFSWERQFLCLPDGTELYFGLEGCWQKDESVDEKDPHTLTPVSHHTVGRFYAVKRASGEHLNDYRNYALCVKSGGWPYFVRPTIDDGILVVERTTLIHVSNLEVTPL